MVVVTEAESTQAFVRERCDWKRVSGLGRRLFPRPAQQPGRGCEYFRRARGKMICGAAGL